MDEIRDPDDASTSPEPTEPGSGPAPATPAPRRRRRGLLVGLGALAAVVIVGVPGALALYLNLARGTADVVDRMVPDDADVYATLYLDPSLSQKLNMQGLLGKIPALKSQDQLQGKIDQGMDMALQPEGLSFAKDVRPWLGTQVALALRVSGGTPTAVIIASKDDARATATLARIRRTDTGRKDTWSEHSHGGITVSVGTPIATGDGTPIAYAYVDHTAVVGNSAAMIESVIDTDRGKRPPLSSTTFYTSTLQRLPADRVALVYAGGPGITAALRQTLTDGGLGDANLLKLFDQGTASLKSVGLAVSAQHNGLAADVAVVTDASKLTPAERAALQPAAAPNSTLDWIPADATGFAAFGGLRDGLQSLLQEMSASAGSAGVDLSGPLGSLGLSDPHGVLSHLTGDVAVEVRTGGASAIPGGALLAATDDAAAVRSFLDSLVGGFSALAPTRTETYRGATITSLAVPGLGDMGVDPAYTVADGMVVIGSSPAEVRAALDAHAAGPHVTASAGFTAAGPFSASQPVLYLDLDRVRAAAEKVLPGDLTHDYDTQVKPNIQALHSVRFTAQASGAQVTERIFLAAG